MWITRARLMVAHLLGPPNGIRPKRHHLAKDGHELTALAQQLLRRFTLTYCLSIQLVPAHPAELDEYLFPPGTLAGEPVMRQGERARLASPKLRQ